MSKSKDTVRDAVAADLRDAIEDVVSQFRPKVEAKPAPIAFVRSRATRHVMDRVQGRSLELMNQYEQVSIRALVVWAANEQDAAPETVEAITEVRFGVNNFSDLPRKDYEEVVKFLIDLRIDEMKN